MGVVTSHVGTIVAQLFFSRMVLLFRFADSDFWGTAPFLQFVSFSIEKVLIVVVRISELVLIFCTFEKAETLHDVKG